MGRSKFACTIDGCISRPSKRHNAERHVWLQHVRKWQNRRHEDYNPSVHKRFVEGHIRRLEEHEMTESPGSLSPPNSPGVQVTASPVGFGGDDEMTDTFGAASSQSGYYFTSAKDTKKSDKNDSLVVFAARFGDAVNSQNSSASASPMNGTPPHSPPAVVASNHHNARHGLTDHGAFYYGSVASNPASNEHTNYAVRRSGSYDSVYYGGVSVNPYSAQPLTTTSMDSAWAHTSHRESPTVWRPW